MNSYFAIPTAIAEFYIQSSLRALQAMNLAGEQSERLLRVALDNGKTAREESLKVVQRWTELGRQSQRVFTDNCNTAAQKTMNEMAKQVERINKQVESFVPTAPAAQPAPATKASKS